MCCRTRLNNTCDRISRDGAPLPSPHRLVQLDVGNMAPASDVDDYDAKKDGARDFALWKAYKLSLDRDGATWDTPFGPGRRG